MSVFSSLLSALCSFLSDSGRHANRNARSPPSTRGPASDCAEAPCCRGRRPLVLGLAFSGMDQLALRFTYREAGDCHCLAPEGISALLGMEEQVSIGTGRLSTRKCEH